MIMAWSRDAADLTLARRIAEKEDVDESDMLGCWDSWDTCLGCLGTPWALDPSCALWFLLSTCSSHLCWGLKRSVSYAFIILVLCQVAFTFRLNVDIFLDLAFVVVFSAFLKVVSVSVLVFSAVAYWVRAGVAVAACVRAFVFQPWPCGSVLFLFIRTSVCQLVASSCCHEARYTVGYQSGLDRCHEARYIQCDISLDLIRLDDICTYTPNMVSYGPPPHHKKNKNNNRENINSKTYKQKQQKQVRLVVRICRFYKVMLTMRRVSKIGGNNPVETKLR